MAEIVDLDVADANNIGRFPENMQFRNVNNGSRALEGILARWSKDINGSLSASGSSGAYSITSNRSIASYADGFVICFAANHTNSGAATLNVSGLGSKTIVRPNGDPLLAGDITSGHKVLVVFVSSLDKFQLLSAVGLPSAVSIGAGTVMAWPGTASIPTGWLECDGTSYAVATYPALHAAVGYAYGGSGANFNVPNYKDYFLRGFDAAGTDAASRTDRGDGVAGANIGTKQEDAFESHLHGDGTLATDTAPDHGHPANFNYAGGTGQTTGGILVRVPGSNVAAYTGTPSESQGQQIGGGGTHSHDVTGSTGSTGGTESRPRNITVKWIILATAAAALATSGIGKNETWFGAEIMRARATSGAASGTRDSGTSDITEPVFDFDTTLAEFVQFTWVPPKRWNRGTVTFIPYWTADAGTPAETFVCTLQGVAISDDDPTNAVMGTAQSSSDALIATGDQHVGPQSAAITIGGSPLVADKIVFQVSRDVAADNLAADARLFGLKLIWTSNATSDD